MNDLPAYEIRGLLNQVARRDDKAVMKLYNHYQKPLYAFIRCQVQDDAAADEILNDTFLVMCRKPEGFDASSKFSTWLVGIAKNKIKDFYRKRGRRPVDVEIDDEMSETLADPNWNVLESLEQEENQAALQKCIERLSPDHRAAVYWVWHEEQTLEETAERLECPTGTVKSRLHHARLKVRDCIEKALGMGGRHG